MTISRHYPVDVAIFGGGVAGLWLLNRLRAQGYHAVLLEREALGAGQTRYAQGIIHGGTKYALTGKLTGSSEAIAAMPAIWRACLAGEGEIDLRQVKLLSPHQYLWSTESVGSRLAGFFASKLMRSRTRTVEGDERPEVLRNPAFKGQVYRLDEPVLDTASLILALAAPLRPYTFVGPRGWQIADHPEGWQIASPGTKEGLLAKRMVLTAGAGNAALLAQCGYAQPMMQLRPLNMVMLRGGPVQPLPGSLYAHCLGASANPRITITSHTDNQGQTVWYLGGQIAEQGVGRSDGEQIAAARTELAELFPWLEVTQAQWGCLPIDRAEPKIPDGSRPDSAFAMEQDGVITAWPTKLALAPCLAEQVMDMIRAAGIEPGGQGDLPAWSPPELARLPWQEEQRWS